MYGVEGGVPESADQCFLVPFAAQSHARFIHVILSYSLGSLDREGEGKWEGVECNVILEKTGAVFLFARQMLMMVEEL